MSSSARRVCVHSLSTDSASNGGNFGGTKLADDSSMNGVMDTHDAIFRGSPGFYVTSTNTHRSTDAASGFGVLDIDADVSTNFKLTL